MKLSVVCLLALVTALTMDGQETSKTELWAGIGVPQPAFRQSETDKLAVSFVVVNDGRTAINPQIGASHLLINGKEPSDWTFVINNGIRSSDFESLPPGRILSFGYELGPRYFAMPGTYSIQWEGRNFRSALLTFRVLPNQK